MKKTDYITKKHAINHIERNYYTEGRGSRGGKDDDVWIVLVAKRA